MLKQILWLGAGALVLASCDGSSGGITVGNTTDEDCSLSWESIAGTEWLFLNAQDRANEVPDIKTRLRIVQEEGKLIARYNVGSLSDFYDYQCEIDDDELICKQEPSVENWCLAMIASGGECTDEMLRQEEPSLTDEQIEEGRKAAMEEWEKHKGKPSEAQFQALFNNMGNKLRGILYMKIDQRNCRLRITDNYKFFYNGQWGEDSNPAGTNAFVSNEEGELLWEHCENPLDLVDLRSADYPSDPANVRNMQKHPVNTEVHYWFLSADWSAPAEGCTYSYDVWHNSRAVAQNQTPETVENVLHWHYTRTFTEPSAPTAPEISTIVATRTCEGKEPEQVVACNAVVVEPAAEEGAASE